MAENNPYSSRIKDHFQQLVRCMEPSEQLLAELSFIDSLREGITRVESASTDNDKNTRLLRILLSSSTDVVNEFIKLLQCNEQHHVANILLGNDDSDIRPMSEQHLALLRKKQDKLCDYLYPSSKLLTFLKSREVLTSNDEARIQYKQSFREMSGELLKILERKPDSAFNALIAGLNNTQQSHVAHILTEKGEPPITKLRIELLDRNRRNLGDNLEPVSSCLVDELLSRAAITEEEHQMIAAQKSTYEQSTCLVDILKRRPDSAFDCFIETLRSTRQGHVAKQILGVNGTVTVNGCFSSSELERSVVTDMQTPMLLRSLQNYGIYSSAEHGSIKIRFTCLSADSLNTLRQLYESGTIDKLLNENYCREFSERGIHSVTVNIPPTEFADAESCALMTSEHRNLLQSAADMFAPYMDVSERLLSGLSLCNRRREAIRSQLTAEERSRRLFDIVSRQADSAFQQFVDTLRLAGYSRVAKFLQKDFPQKDSPQPNSPKGWRSRHTTAPELPEPVKPQEIRRDPSRQHPFYSSRNVNIFNDMTSRHQKRGMHSLFITTVVTSD